MLKHTGAFSSFSANNLNAAKTFYSQILGLGVTERTEGLEVRISKDTTVFMYPKPNHVPATFTVLNFHVDDIEATVEDLAKLGVKFEHYNEGEIKTDEKGIARTSGPMIAWFKDPSGNILSVLQEK